MFGVSWNCCRSSNIAPAEIIDEKEDDIRSGHDDAPQIEGRPSMPDSSAQSAPAIMLRQPRVRSTTGDPIRDG